MLTFPKRLLAPLLRNRWEDGGEEEFVNWFWNWWVIGQSLNFCNCSFQMDLFHKKKKKKSKHFWSKQAWVKALSHLVLTDQRHREKLHFRWANSKFVGPSFPNRKKKWLQFTDRLVNIFLSLLTSCIKASSISQATPAPSEIKASCPNKLRANSKIKHNRCFTPPDK